MSSGSLKLRKNSQNAPKTVVLVKIVGSIFTKTKTRNSNTKPKHEPGTQDEVLVIVCFVACTSVASAKINLCRRTRSARFLWTGKGDKGDFRSDADAGWEDGFAETGIYIYVLHCGVMCWQ